MPNLEETLDFIRGAHAGQQDKAGDPYWFHPFSVMLRLGPLVDERARHVALLHDVLEDTPFTEHDLRQMGFPRNIVQSVVLLTKAHTKLRYISWIRSIVRSGDKMAIAVKIADIQDNLNPRRVAAIDPQMDHDAGDRLLRYTKALYILEVAQHYGIGIGEKETAGSS